MPRPWSPTLTPTSAPLLVLYFLPILDNPALHSPGRRYLKIILFSEAASTALVQFHCGQWQHFFWHQTQLIKSPSILKFPFHCLRERLLVLINGECNWCWEQQEGRTGRGRLMRGPVCRKEINSVAGLRCSTGSLSLPWHRACIEGFHLRNKPSIGVLWMQMSLMQAAPAAGPRRLFQNP